MGFQRKSKFIFFCIILNVCHSELKAQDNDTINLDFIYNEWALSRAESYDNVLVYGDEDDFIFNDIPHNKDSNLKFTSYDDYFYLKYSEWKRPPRRCGNGPAYNGPRSKTSWKKGIWKIEIDGDYTFLILEHLEATNGKKYVRLKRLEYQILDLTEDRMVLQKITEESVN